MCIIIYPTYQINVILENSNKITQNSRFLVNRCEKPPKIVNKCKKFGQKLADLKPFRTFALFPNGMTHKRWAQGKRGKRAEVLKIQSLNILIFEIMNIKNYPFANKVVKFVVKETCDSAIENGFEYAVGKTVSIKLTEISDDNIYGVFTTGKLKGTQTCLAYGGNGLGLWVDGCENYDLDVFLTAETAKAESIEEFLKIGFQCLLQQRLDDFEEEVETWFEDGFHGAWY